MLTLILIVNFQARLTQELKFQTQEVAFSGAEVDEHAVTRHVLGERRGHERAIGRKLKCVGSSIFSTVASHAYFAPGFSSVAPSYEELDVARVESQMYKQRLDAQLQCRMPDLQYPGLYSQYTQPDLNAKEEDEVEDEDQNLAND